MSVRMNQIQSFIITAQSGSFASAAEKLFISSPALIQQINSFEKELGLTLFIRNHQGVQLTESGQYFYNHIIPLYQDYEKTLQTCHEIEGNKNVIRFGSYEGWHQSYLYYGTFSLFSETHEHTSLQYVSTKREKVLEDCKNNLFDIGFYNEPADIKSFPLRYTPLKPQDIYAIMSPDHPLAQKEHISKKDLEGHLIFVDNNFSTQELLHWLQHNPALHIKADTFTLKTIFKVCNSGAILLATDMVAPFLTPLRGIPLDIPFQLPLGFITKKNPSPAVQTFVDFFKQHSN